MASMPTLPPPSGPSRPVSARTYTMIRERPASGGTSGGRRTPSTSGGSAAAADAKDAKSYFPQGSGFAMGDRPMATVDVSRHNEGIHNHTRIDTFQTPQGLGLAGSEKGRFPGQKSDLEARKPCMLPLQGGYALLGKWDVIEELHADLRAEMASLRQNVTSALKMHRDELENSSVKSHEAMKEAILEEVQSLRLIFPDALDSVRRSQKEAVSEIRADLNAGIDLLRQEFCQSFGRVLKIEETRAQERQEILEEVRKSVKGLADEIRENSDMRKRDLGEVLTAEISPVMTHLLCNENRQAEMRDTFREIQARDAREQTAIGESIKNLQLSMGTAFNRIESRHQDIPNQIVGLVLNAVGNLDLHTGFDSISAEIGTLRGSHALLLSDLREEVRRAKTEMVQELRIVDLHSKQAAGKIEADSAAAFDAFPVGSQQATEASIEHRLLES